TNPDGSFRAVQTLVRYATRYEYDSNKNLTKIFSADAQEMTQSDSDNARAFRASLGIVDATGQGKLAKDLSTAAQMQAGQVSEQDFIIERFSKAMSYDTHGNLLTVREPWRNAPSYVLKRPTAPQDDDSVTTYTYNAQGCGNRPDTEFSATGYSLLHSDVDWA